MSKRDRPDAGEGDLGQAAAALQRELQRFEELAAAAGRAPLDTRKAIERAAKATTEAASGQERVDLALGGLVQAITAARERHEANAAALQARGEEIRLRAAEFAALFDRYSALGEEGASINQLVQDAAARQREATTPEGTRALVAAIVDIEERMSRLATSARELGQEATLASIADLAQQADSLRQQVAAARNKLGLLRKSLESAPPDPSQLN